MSTVTVKYKIKIKTSKLFVWFVLHAAIIGTVGFFGCHLNAYLFFFYMDLYSKIHVCTQLPPPKKSNLFTKNAWSMPLHCDFWTAKLRAPRSLFPEHLRPPLGFRQDNLKITHVIDVDRSRSKRHHLHALMQSLIVSICVRSLTNTGLHHIAAAPPGLSVCRSLCVRGRAPLKPSADSRSACEPSGGAAVLLLVNRDFKSTNCSRCHATQAGRCSCRHSEPKQNL